MEEDSSGPYPAYRFTDFLYWNLLLAIPFLTACIGIFPVSILGLMGYILLCLSMTAVIYRFFCTHCPHYARSSGKTRCMFFWGLPGFFKSEKGPYRPIEIGVTIAGCLIVALFPIGWLRLQPGLLIIYLLSLTALIVGIRRNECSRCAHTHCPVNHLTAAADAESAADLS